MKVPIAEPVITPNDLAAVTECVASGWISGVSPWVKRFEEEFAEYIGVPDAVATSSGTTALHLGAVSIGIKPGDEVILPSFTMIASANILHYLGAKPVFCDIMPHSWCMDPVDVESKINSRTKAIMPIHVYGHPVSMGIIRDLAIEYDLKVIEDVAEAHGGEWKHKKLGSLGDCGCFSFFANKIITTGEGGMITFSNHDDAENARWLRAHAFGRHGKHYWHEAVGFGYRMSGMQAALGSSQLKDLDKYAEIHWMNAWRYKMLLKPLSDEHKIIFPHEDYKVEKNVYWMFSVLINESYGMSRDEVVAELEKKGVETRTFFYPLHKQPPYQQDIELPVTDAVASRGINLPSGNALKPEQIEYVCDCLMELANK